ncbi:MAG: hypothetical protein R2755_09760 [Acidimicrobiales bacterium]
MANAAAVVPLVFGAAYLLGVFVTTRPEIAGDPTRLVTASAVRRGRGGRARAVAR